MALAKSAVRFVKRDGYREIPRILFPFAPQPVGIARILATMETHVMFEAAGQVETRHARAAVGIQKDGFRLQPHLIGRSRDAAACFRTSLHRSRSMVPVCEWK